MRFLPRFVIPHIWLYFKNRFSYQHILIAAQVYSVLCAIVQLYAVLIYNEWLLYVSTFLLGIGSSMLFVIYDTCTLGWFHREQDIHKSNAILVFIRYTGLMGMPILGGLIATYYGNNMAMRCNIILQFTAIGIFLFVKSSLNISENDKSRISYSHHIKQFSSSQVVSLMAMFIYNACIGVFSFVLPAFAFMTLNMSKQNYGILGSIMGLFLVIGSYVVGHARMATIDHGQRYIVLITLFFLTAIMNVFGFYSQQIATFFMWMIGMSFISAFLLVYLKTHIFSMIGNASIKQVMPPIYTFIQGAGVAMGFLLCSLLGNSMSDYVFVWIYTCASIIVAMGLIWRYGADKKLGLKS